jgi:hypothetical protein
MADAKPPTLPATVGDTLDMLAAPIMSPTAAWQPRCIWHCT